MMGASRIQKVQVVDKKDTCQNLALVVNYAMANLSIVNGCCIHHQQVPSFALRAHYSQAHSLIFPHLNLMTESMLQNVYLDTKMAPNIKNMLNYSSRQKESGQFHSILLKQFYNAQLYW